MKILVMILVLLFFGVASAQFGCYATCCEKYGGTWEDGDCSIGPDHADFRKYGTCTGYCLSGQTPPGTPDSAPDTSPEPAVTPSVGNVAPDPYYEDDYYDDPYGQPSSGFCGLGAVMLALLGVAAVKV